MRKAVVLALTLAAFGWAQDNLNPGTQKDADQLPEVNCVPKASRTWTPVAASGPKFVTVIV